MWEFVRFGTRGGRGVAILSRPGSAGARCDDRALQITDEPLPAAPEGAFPEHVVMGAVVQLTTEGARAAKCTTDTLWVVTADKGEKVNAAPLGGHNDRYFRAPRVYYSRVVPLEEVPGILAK